MKDKPIYLWPFIGVYRLVMLIFKIPVMLVYYFFMGVLTTVAFISFAWWKFLKYLAFGFSFPFVVAGRSIKGDNKPSSKKTATVVVKPSKKKKSNFIEADIAELAKTNPRLAKKLAKKKAKEQARKERLEAKRKIKKAKEEAKLRKANKNLDKLNEAAEARRKRNALIQEQNMDLMNKNRQEIVSNMKESDKKSHGKVVRRKKSIGEAINDFLEGLITKTARSKDSGIAKHKINKQELQREAILLDLTGKDAVKSEKKQVYEYVAKNPDGDVVTGYFDAFSKVEVHSFLLSEGYEVYSIKTNGWIRFIHGSQEVKGVKFKMKDLLFFLTQLSTYIKAGIPLVESLRILSKQFAQKGYQKIFRAMIYDLTMGDNFSTAMEKQGNAFPKILSNMIKTSEMTGELPEILDDMQKYFDETDKTRKQMITALTYPTIVFVLAIAASAFIMIYIVPKFVTIYAGMDNAQLPAITQIILAISDFLVKKWPLLLGIIAGVIIIFIYLYKNVKVIRYFMQYGMMHVPVIGNVIIYNEVTMFTKTFASLLKHNVFITDTMDILNKISNNEVWKVLILDCIANLSKGEKISLAFKGQWAVPIPAYEMIVTGERTGQLPEMMQKVSEYYQELHRNAVGRIKSFIEPFLILFLVGVVGVIVLSIIIPMFDMYNQLT